MTIVFLIGLGLVSGIIAGLFGLGGGIIVVPALSLCLGYDMPNAVGISIMQMVFVSFFGTFLNYKKGLLDFKNGLMLGFGGICGSSLSGSLLKIVDAKILSFAFLAFTVFSFYKYFFKMKQIIVPKEVDFKKRFCVLFFSGALIGLLSSSLGIGGTLLLAPILGYFLGINSKQMAPLGLFFISFSSLSGSISLFRAGFVDVSYGVLLGLLSMIGVFLGTNIMQKMNETRHKFVLSFIYCASILATSIKIFNYYF